MIAVWLFLAVPWVCLRFVIVVFPDHTHLLFLQQKRKQTPSVMIVISSCVFLKFAPRLGPTESRVWSEFKLFDTLMVLLKDFFSKWFILK